jgi:hypothetical protein
MPVNILKETKILNPLNLEPVIVENSLSKDFPHVSQCGKCAKENVCLCKTKSISCCKYCKCIAKCRKERNGNLLYFSFYCNFTYR